MKDGSYAASLILGPKMSIKERRHNCGRNASSLSLIDSTLPIWGPILQVSWDRPYPGARLQLNLQPNWMHRWCIWNPNRVRSGTIRLSEAGLQLRFEFLCIASILL